MTPHQVTIAILGAGIFAREAHLPAIATLAASGAVKLAAVYSRSRASAAALASDAKSLLKLGNPPDIYFDVDDNSSPDKSVVRAGDLTKLLERSDINAVIIALPITLQPSIVLKCLAAGKHVLSEKPVAPTVAEGIKLIAEYEKAYKTKNLIWRVAENYEAEPGYRAAADVIKQGLIGDVRFFRLTAVGYVGADSKWYKTPWRTVPDYQGGFLLDGGVHSAAILRMLLPPITQLTSYASLSRAHLAPEDTITALLSCSPMQSGSDSAIPPKDRSAHGIFELSFASPHPSRSGAAGGGLTILTGSKGWMELKQTSNDKGESVFRITVHSVTHEQKDENDEVQEKVIVIDERERGVEAEITAFIHAINGDASDDLGEPREALKDVAVIQAALRSEGKVIDLQKLVTEG